MYSLVKAFVSILNASPSSPLYILLNSILFTISSPEEPSLDLLFLKRDPSN